ncbi:phospholipid:diacylglycerol acyltransferase [Rhizoctonia solani AG-1 IA]|uniref:Phospholipid:diacylglycerol acyltransferase n=1 Tax=Thanatephorus cucumeris (strain AG1-IA) TaxID=983506 RepID=L8WQZ5_THACA|nr:phospholipid:diacylglycerol acyltransferase [Rhizoctonia solani AG-1 IA]
MSSRVPLNSPVQQKKTGTMLKLPNVRRRRKPSNPPKPETESTISEIATPAQDDDKVVVSADTITKLQKHKYQSERDVYFSHWAWHVRLGQLLAPPTLLTLATSWSFEEYDLTSLSLPGLEFEWDQIAQSISKSTPGNLWAESKDFRVGTELKEQGLEASHPVILIPGIVSTSWTTSPEYRSYFRKRLWGTTTMVRAVLTDRDRWIAALMLDPDTGLDPPGIKVRAAQGLDAAITTCGMSINGDQRSKIIENLAVINYDTNNLYMAAYDWRLSYYNLEVRDGYFSRYGPHAGHAGQTNKKQTKSSSRNIQAPSYGNGGPNWVEVRRLVLLEDLNSYECQDHIEAFVNVAGTLLTPRTAQGNGCICFWGNEGYRRGQSRGGLWLVDPCAWARADLKTLLFSSRKGGLHQVRLYDLSRAHASQFFSRKERARLFRSWAGSASMWIKGGDAVWGTPAPFASSAGPTPTTNQTQTQTQAQAETEPAPTYGAPDDPPNASPEDSHARFFNFRASPPAEHVQSGPGIPGNLSAEQAGNWLLGNVEEKCKLCAESSGGLEIKWCTALQSMRIYCLYGHGKPTERSYWYAASEFEHEGSENATLEEECAAEFDETRVNSSCVTQKTPLNMPLSRRNFIDVAVHNDTGVPKVSLWRVGWSRLGAICLGWAKSALDRRRLGEGDGTVALLSLGAMCVEGWKAGTRWNPHGVRVVTQEMAHKPEPFDPRGGQTTSDHIDILGSEALNLAVLRIAAGRGEDVEERFVSNIQDYAKKIRWE